MVEYINEEGASCLGSRGLIIFVQEYVEYLNLIGVSPPCNREFNYLIKGIAEYIYVEKLHASVIGD